MTDLAASGRAVVVLMRGRDGEVASLHEHLARLRSGAETSWLIGGGPGLGKSRLVEEAVSAAQETGFAVGHGVAEPGDAGRSTAPSRSRWRNRIRSALARPGS